MKKSTFKVFIQEDDRAMQKQITQELKGSGYKINFFSKSESVFDLLNFNPDILIQDYKSNKVINCYKWSAPYNHWN